MMNSKLQFEHLKKLAKQNPKINDIVSLLIRPQAQKPKYNNKLVNKAVKKINQIIYNHDFDVDMIAESTGGYVIDPDSLEGRLRDDITDESELSHDFDSAQAFQDELNQVTKAAHSDEYVYYDKDEAEASRLSAGDTLDYLVDIIDFVNNH